MFNEILKNTHTKIDNITITITITIIHVVINEINLCDLSANVILISCYLGFYMVYGLIF